MRGPIEPGVSPAAGARSGRACLWRNDGGGWRVRNPALQAVAWTLLVAGAGCGDATGPPDEPEPITIAATVSETGIRTQSANEMGRGYQLAVGMVNEMGGISGRQVRLVTRDDGSDPATAARLYEEFIATDSIDALLGPFSTPITEAVVAVAEVAGWPLIAAMAAAPDVWSDRGRRWSVQMLDQGPARLRGAVELAARHGARTVALIYEDSPFPASLARGVRDAAQAHGLTTALDRSYPVGGADHAGLVAAARAAGSDLFIGGGYYDDAVAFTQALAAAEYAPLMVSLSLGPADPRFGQDVGDLARCMSGPASWIPAVQTSGSIADSETFVERYRQAHGSAPGYHAAGGFGAVELLAEAIEATTTAEAEVDPVAVRDYLFSVSTETVLGPYSAGGLVQRIVHPEAAADAEPCFLR